MLIFILLPALKPYYDAKQVPSSRVSLFCPFLLFAFIIVKVLYGVERKVGLREEEWTQDMTQVRLESPARSSYTGQLHKSLFTIKKREKYHLKHISEDLCVHMGLWF